MIKLFNNNGFRWKNNAKIWLKGYLFDGDILKTDKQIFTELEQICTTQDLKIWLKKANGCFSLIIETCDFIWLAVDNIRTFPLFYSTDNKGITITDNPTKIFHNASEINLLAANELESAAYVTGKNTLYKNVYQVQAGELIIYSKKVVNGLFHADFFTKKIYDSSFEQLQNKLITTLNKTFQRLITSLNGRQAIVPLSGGYDSRLIAVMLKKFGYQNVVTFTFGRANHGEVNLSKQVAQTLGFKWNFVEYNSLIINNFINSEVFKNYYHFAGKATAMFYMQDYFAVKYLSDNQIIDKDAVFIPGHSGDAVAGSHLREYMRKKMSRKQLLNLIYAKTYNQNNHKKHKKQFLKLIDNFIDQYYGNIPTYNIFESWVYAERQAKFIVNSANIFDFFGYEYRLPFWDTELVDFFKSVPFEYKLYKKLYDNTLKNNYFNKYNVDFNNEIQINSFDIKKQRIKNKIRPHLHKKCKLYFLNKNDWAAYEPITKYFLNNLKERNIPYLFRADSYNSIISRWYVECFRK